MTVRRQIERLVLEFERHPETVPLDRFEHAAGGRVHCVLCRRSGYGYVGPTPRSGALDFGGRVMRWNCWYPCSPWQLACLVPHDWPCSCGRQFPSFANLWRHIGAARPRGWGRAGVHVPVLACPWPVVA